MNVASSLLQHEFIGLEAEIVRSTNPSQVGIRGKVLDETQKTLTILHKNKQKIIAKETSIFHFILLDGTILEVDGKILLGRPEDRVKKQMRRLW
jgi:ribonuclease P protein subunit POP4